MTWGGYENFDMLCIYDATALNCLAITLHVWNSFIVYII